MNKNISLNKTINKKVTSFRRYEYDGTDYLSQYYHLDYHFETYYEFKEDFLDAFVSMITKDPRYGLFDFEKVCKIIQKGHDKYLFDQ